MTRSARKSIIVGVLIAFMVLATPAQAHAGFADIAGFGLGAVLDIIDGLVSLYRLILLQAISWLGNALQAVMNLKISTGGKPVYTAWRVLRDFCNMSFIVVLILMAFGTIFDSFSFSFLKAFYVRSRGVISGFLIAAIALNFSLAIGQAVVATSNQITTIVLGVFPKDLGASMAQAVNLSSTQLGQKVTSGAGSPPVLDSVATEGLTPNQKLALTLVDGAARSQFSECLKTNKDTSYNCYNRIIIPALQKAQAASEATRNANQQFVSLNLAENFKCLFGSGCAPIQQGDNWTKVRLIGTNMWLVFLSMVFLISLLLPFAFSLIRIPFVWVLLALSPLAWTSKAFPGSGYFSEWWKQFMAWNIFTPLYLFVIYLGMMLTQKTAELNASLITQDGTVPLITGFLGEVFGYGMVALVFLGGTAAALKMAFSGGSYAKSVADNISGRLGIDGKYGAFAPAGRLTGATAAYDTLRATAAARGEKLAQTGRGILERSRVAQIVKPVSYEEKLAKLRGRMGVTGAAKEYADLKSGQVTAAQKILSSELASVAKDKQQDYLRNKMNSPDRSVALAAREELLNRGLLSKDDIESTRKLYAKVNPAAERAFADRVKRSAGKAALERKKEAETKRDEIVATVGIDMTNAEASGTTPDQIVKDTLARYTDPDDQKAAMEALGKKYPMQVANHLKSPAGGGVASDVAIYRAFEDVIKNPKDLLKLPSDYFDSSKDEGINLLGAISGRYSTAAAPGTAEERRYSKFKEGLLDQASGSQIAKLRTFLP